MPNQRFFNLKPEKQERVLTRYLEEFTDRNYRQASVSRIVEDLGIAKGSLFQYFGSKNGLYDYLILYPAETKLNYLQNRIAWENPDFGELLAEMFLEGFQFDLEHPLVSRFIVQTNQAGNDDFPESSAAQMRREALRFMQNLVQQG